MNGITVATAQPGELVPALRLLFQRYTPEETLDRVNNALAALECGELDPAGVFVARSAAGLCGVLTCRVLRGACALVWPPQVAGPADVETLEDRLIRYALDFLRNNGTQIAQTLLLPEEADQAAPLLRHGFRHITTLEFLRHSLEQQAEGTELAEWLEAPERLTYHSYDAWSADLFQQTLLRTYEGGLDCPELNSRRDVRHIIDGHQGQGHYDPKLWWLVQEYGRPVGVLLLNELPAWRSMDVSYLGIVPAARGRGYGRELTCRALRTAHAAGMPQVTLTVDRRNRPACHLYARLGFEWCDEREVFLAFLS